MPAASGERPLAVGCMRLSTEPDRDQARALATLHAAFDAGVTLLDTADAYCLDPAETGHNERLVARALASWDGDRSRVRIATKGGLTRPGGAWVADGRARHLAAACEASRRALGLERVHLYQLHAPDPRVPLATSVRALAPEGRPDRAHRPGQRVAGPAPGGARDRRDRVRAGRAEPLAGRRRPQWPRRALRRRGHPAAGASAAGWRRAAGPPRQGSGLAGGRAAARGHAGGGGARVAPWPRRRRGAAAGADAAGDRAIPRARAGPAPLRGGRGRAGRAFPRRAAGAHDAGGPPPSGRRGGRSRARHGTARRRQEHARRRAGRTRLRAAQPRRSGRTALGPDPGAPGAPPRRPAPRGARQHVRLAGGAQRGDRGRLAARRARPLRVAPDQRRGRAGQRRPAPDHALRKAARARRDRPRLA